MARFTCCAALVLAFFYTTTAVALNMPANNSFCTVGELGNATCGEQQAAATEMPAASSCCAAGELGNATCGATSEFLRGQSIAATTFFAATATNTDRKVDDLTRTMNDKMEQLTRTIFDMKSTMATAADLAAVKKDVGELKAFDWRPFASLAGVGAAAGVTYILGVLKSTKDHRQPARQAPPRSRPRS